MLRARPRRAVAALPAVPFLEVVALGYREAAADLAWMQAVQYYGEYRQRSNDLSEFDHYLHVVNTLDRRRLWSIQTPQAFRYNLLMQAHLYARENGIQVTDDASLIEELGDNRVKLVMGTSENIKITTPGDLAIAEAILKAKGQL